MHPFPQRAQGREVLRCPRHSTVPAHAWPGARGCAGRKGRAGPPSLLVATTTLASLLPSQILEFEGQKVPLLLEPTLCCCFLLSLSQTWEILQTRRAGVFLLCKSIVAWMCFTQQVLVVGHALGILKSSLDLFFVKQGQTFLLCLMQDKLGELEQDGSHSQTR